MSSGGLRTTHYQFTNMNKENTKLQNSTNPTITYNECYVQCGDNLELLKSQPNESVNMIYCDILYGTGRNFGDYKDLKPIRSEIESHYIPRIKEMHRILKPTGSIYLQMDYKINHWLRLIIEDIGLLFQNQIVWHYGLGNNNKKRNWQDKHDVILFATKTKDYTWNDMRGDITPQMKAKYCHQDGNGFYMMSYGKKYYLKGGKRMGNVFDLPNLSATDGERVGYNTQKPKELIRRFVLASTNEGDVVADYYLGSGTTAKVCQELNRNFIGCDLNPKAIEITKARLNSSQ
jgi:site-specific DNA-methyltransferase (adenine-specific)